MKTNFGKIMSLTELIMDGIRPSLELKSKSKTKKFVKPMDRYSGGIPMTCTAVIAPLLANENDSSQLLREEHMPKQQRTMAPSIKQEPQYPGVTQPFFVNRVSRQVPPPKIKMEQSVPDLDDSLTSLNWLHDINVMKFGQLTPPSSPTPVSYPNYQPENLPTYIQKQQLRLMSESCGLDSDSFLNKRHGLQDGIDYKFNSCMKPPYSYATLIWMAMKDSKNSKITLSAIYKWITDNFKYYRTAEPSWQNSIRHNLSLNKCFQRVVRSKDEPGKGGFWRIDPVHAELLESGIWKKRRAYSLPEMEYGPLKRIRRECLHQTCDDTTVIQPQEQLQDVPSLALELPENLPQFGSDGKVFDIEVIQPKAEGMRRKRRSKSRSKKRSKSKHSKRSKHPKISTYQEDSSTSEDDNLPSSVLNEAFQWDSIFNQEIEVDGVRVKAEAILSPNGEVQLLPVIDSPPSSEESDDLSMFLPMGESPLDLSIRGTHIPRPLWFEGSQTAEKTTDHHQSEERSHGTILPESVEELFGLPSLPPSPASSPNGQVVHPWAEDRDKVEDLYFEEFLNLQDSGSFGGATWAPNHAIQTVIIEK